jgi:ribosomal protein S19E (S16A)
MDGGWWMRRAMEWLRKIEFESALGCAGLRAGYSSNERAGGLLDEAVTAA